MQRPYRDCLNHTDLNGCTELSARPCCTHVLMLRPVHAIFWRCSLSRAWATVWTLCASDAFATYGAIQICFDWLWSQVRYDHNASSYDSCKFARVC